MSTGRCTLITPVVPSIVYNLLVNLGYCTVVYAVIIADTDTPTEVDAMLGPHD